MSPSPLGELYFLMILNGKNGSKKPMSVPSRGAIFLNLSNISLFTCQCVSVPSRGAIFLNDRAKKLMKKWKNRFPSPLGELYFLIST